MQIQLTFLFSLMITMLCAQAPPPPPPPPPPSHPETFKIVEEMPHFPYDEENCTSSAMACSKEAMLTYIYNELKYPNAAKEAEAQGMAIIIFVVEKDGTLADLRIARNPGMGMGEEALRIVEKMADNVKWIPGRQRGRLVRVQFTLPVKFQLDENQQVIRTF